MNPAKTITRVPVPDLRRLRAKTPAAPMNIALIGICGGATLTRPGGLAQLAAIARSSLPASSVPRRCAGCWPGPARAGWPGSTRSTSTSTTT